MTDETQPSPPVEKQSEHRIKYHREVALLRSDLIRLGAMVIETIPQGTEILLSGSLTGAQALVDKDDEIDSLSISVEERTYSLMARQAPIAGELRHLIAVTKLTAELERSADLMVNITKAARRMYGDDLTPQIRGLVKQMSDEAHKLMRLAIDAYADADESLAAALDDIDDELDQLNRDMIEAIFAAAASGAVQLQGAVQLALIARYYERIGDHAVNIGDRVRYMISGWLPEEAGAIRAQKRMQIAEDET